MEKIEAKMLELMNNPPRIKIEYVKGLASRELSFEFNREICNYSAKEIFKFLRKEAKEHLEVIEYVKPKQLIRFINMMKDLFLEDSCENDEVISNSDGVGGLSPRLISQDDLSISNTENEDNADPSQIVQRSVERSFFSVGDGSNDELEDEEELDYNRIAEFVEIPQNFRTDPTGCDAIDSNSN